MDQATDQGTKERKTGETVVVVKKIANFLLLRKTPSRGKMFLKRCSYAVPITIERVPSFAKRLVNNSIGAAFQPYNMKVLGSIPASSNKFLHFFFITFLCAIFIIYHFLKVLIFTEARKNTCKELLKTKALHLGGFEPRTIRSWGRYGTSEPHLQRLHVKNGTGFIPSSIIERHLL